MGECGNNVIVNSSVIIIVRRRWFDWSACGILVNNSSACQQLLYDLFLCCVECVELKDLGYTQRARNKETRQ